jgi:DNA-binding GntR family transcriptional regulator
MAKMGGSLVEGPGIAKRRGRVRMVPPTLGAIDPDSGATAERQVYRLLRRGMMAGLFAPGSSLTGRSIAESLAISPSPVRDALKRLEADGVIESRDKSAYYVTELSREQYLDIINLRMTIEGDAAGAAAKASRAEDVARLEAIHFRYSNTADVAENIRINYLFHFEIYKLASSPILIDVVENLWMRIGPVMHLHMQVYGVGEVTDSHGRLIDAIKRHDQRGATRALKRDLSEASKVIAPKLATNRSARTSSSTLVATLDTEIFN